MNTSVRLTVDLNRKIMAEARKLGLTKSDLIRDILEAHYQEKETG